MESETRTEYRVVGDGEPPFYYGQAQLPRAKAQLRYEEKRGVPNARIQAREVSETPWEDVTDA